ncbi:MAG TPA: protein dehydratase [Myxococcales bacterium]|nr:protein dehydratase [Myxococcales bacterium]HIK86313.1 protein dehydratase [Myxococcales bacterium]
MENSQRKSRSAGIIGESNRDRGGVLKVEVGDSIPSWTMDRVTPERMKTVAAILRDPTPIHWDRDVTRAIGFDGRLLNQSPINLGYVINMLITWAGPECVRRIRTEFPLPVLDGDCVTAGGVVKAIETQEGVDVAECEVWLDRDDGTRTVQARAWVAIAKEGVTG